MSQNSSTTPAAQKLRAIIEEMRNYAEVAKEAKASADKSMREAEEDKETSVFLAIYSPIPITEEAEVDLIKGYINKIYEAVEVAKENSKLAKISADAATKAAIAVEHTFGYSLSVAKRSQDFLDFEAALKTVEGVMHIAISETSKATKAAEDAFGYAAVVKEAEAEASKPSMCAVNSLPE